jgi:hypothetical protein
MARAMVAILNDRATKPGLVRADQIIVVENDPALRKVLSRTLALFMPGAFVVRLGPETKPKPGLFGGWAEVVAFCDELRFRSTDKRLTFLGNATKRSLDQSSRNRAIPDVRSWIRKEQLRWGSNVH